MKQYCPFCFNVRDDVGLTLYDSTGQRKYLNRKERLRYYFAAQALKDKSQRAFCLTLYHTGCRMSEILNLTPNQIDLPECKIVIITLKQRDKTRLRAIPVKPELIRLLKSLIELMDINPEQRIWPFSRTTGWRLVKQLMEKAKLDGVKATAKGLRHTFGVECVMRGVDVTNVQRWMGHASLKTTKIYLGVSGEEERRLISRIWHTDVLYLQYYIAIFHRMFKN